MKSILSPKLIPFWNWLKEAGTNVWRFTLGILLLSIGLLLLPLVTVAAIGFYFATLRKKKQNAREIMQSQGATYKLIAIGINILGNIIGGSFFNWLLLKKPSQFPYGIPGQKISTVTQLNYKLDNLSEWGLNLKHDLDTIEEDHCEKAMMKALFKAKHLIERYKKIQHRMETIERTKEFMAKYN